MTVPIQIVPSRRKRVYVKVTPAFWLTYIEQ